jgi:transcriptional regulator with XRE-family HTH domain
MTVIQFPVDTRPLTSRVSDEVRALMGRHRITQRDLAVWMGLNQTAISARLRGATEWKVSEIERVADGFGVHPSELMGGHSTNPRPDGPDGGIKIVRHQGLEPRTR